jgi:hypothetical protein
MTTTCQICGRAIKAANGKIAHHGYRRPNSGWQTASCFGARWRPWEVACDAIEPAIAAAKRFQEGQEKLLAEIKAEPPAELFVKPRYGYSLTEKAPRPEGFDQTQRPVAYRMNQRYERAYFDRIDIHTRNIREAGEDIVALRQRLASWEPKNIT